MGESGREDSWLFASLVTPQQGGDFCFLLGRWHPLSCGPLGGRI